VDFKWAHCKSAAGYRHRLRHSEMTFWRQASGKHMKTGANPVFSMQSQVGTKQRLRQSYYTDPSLTQIRCVCQPSLMCYTTCQQLTWKLAGEPERDCTFTPHFSGSSLNASSARFCSPHALCQMTSRWLSPTDTTVLCQRSFFCDASMWHSLHRDQAH